MVLDSSAILALYFQEPAAPWIAERIAEAPRVLMSTVNLAECIIKFRDRQPTDAQMMEDRLLATRTLFVPPDAAQAILAAKARVTLPLNFGDCFAYALARNRRTCRC